MAKSFEARYAMQHSNFPKPYFENMIGPFPTPNHDSSKATQELKSKVSFLELRVESLETRIRYFEFLTGRVYLSEVIVCPANAPIDMIAKKLVGTK